MDRRSLISVLLVLLCLNLSTQSTLSQPLKISDHKLSDKLLNKGYGAMGVFDLEGYLEHLLKSAPSKLTHNITSITVFCPTDQAFISQNHLGIPTTLLQYHVIPFKVDRKTLESLPHGSTFPTFLVDAPHLVKTLVPYTGEVSINNVTIVDWEMYNDGKVILHGVDDYFNPAWPILYPSAVAEEDCAECGENVDDNQVPKRSGKSLSSAMEDFLESPILPVLLMVVLAILAMAILGLSCQRYYSRKTTWDKYLPVDLDPDDNLV